VGVSVGTKVAVGDNTGVGGIVLVGVGSFLNKFSDNPPPVSHKTIIAMPMTTSTTARIAIKVGKKGFLFL
jgi:hypothetical protein